jgi:hypothetical protein
MRLTVAKSRFHSLTVSHSFQDEAGNQNGENGTSFEVFRLSSNRRS